MRILKPFMLLAVIGVLYSCAAVHLQTYRNGYIMDKNNVVVGYYWNGYLLDLEEYHRILCKRVYLRYSP